jgi:hypothetical protein
MSEEREKLKERLAAYIATEWDHEIDPVVGAAWPEREGDDGYRGNGGYIAIQPSDVLARCREQADRLLSFLDTEQTQVAKAARD